MKKAGSENFGKKEIQWLVDPADLELELGKSSKVRQVLVFTKGMRAKYNYSLVEEGATLEQLIVFVGSGNESLFLNGGISHISRNTLSKVGLKAILFDQSRLDFKGSIFVGEEAHGTDTYLKCESLLMSDQAISKTIPSLEIIANDVKAGHAATAGRVDEESLFYLESRGFDKMSAKKLLVEAFLVEAGRFFTDLDEESMEGIAKKLINLLPKYE